MSGSTDDRLDLTIFIGHRRDDLKFAEVLRRTLQEWDAGRTPASRAVSQITIYTSSEFDGQNGAKEKVLLQTDVVLLLLTEVDEEWVDCVKNGCIATGSLEVPAHIFMLQIVTGANPGMDGAVMDFMKGGVPAFTEAFHNGADFFLRADGPLCETGAEEVSRKSSVLRERIREAKRQQAIAKKAKPLIFISHRTEDKQIADVMRETIVDWSNNEIDVFQSSNARRGAASSDDINSKVREKLRAADVVFLIYTDSGEDWQYCMWECGHAQAMNKRILVFQCREDIPSPFDSLLAVSIELEEIQRFALTFQHAPDFLPSLGGPVNANVDDGLIQRRSERLLKRLVEAIPNERPRDISRWYCLTLSLILQPEQLKKIRDAGSFVEQVGIATEFIQPQCTVIEAPQSSLDHFDLGRLDENLTLFDVYMNWKEKKGTAEFDWFSGLCEDITRIILNKSSIEVGVPFESCSNENRWYLPIIHHATSEQSGLQWSFSVDLYRIPHDGKYIKIVKPDEYRTADKQTDIP